MDNFDVLPVSFRAGRWGYNKDVAKNLSKIGYKVGSSITPYVDWTGYSGPDYSAIAHEPFKFMPPDIFKQSCNGKMVEIATTVGFLQKNFELCSFVTRILRRKPIKYLKLIGILDSLNILNKVWLSPELSDCKTMIKLTRVMMGNRNSLVNLMFHSTSLKAGLSPFVKNEDDEINFLENIENYLKFTTDCNIQSVTLSEAATAI